MRISDWSSDVCSSDFTFQGKTAILLLSRQKKLIDNKRRPIRHKAKHQCGRRSAEKSSMASPLVSRDFLMALYFSSTADLYTTPSSLGCSSRLTTGKRSPRNCPK